MIVDTGPLVAVVSHDDEHHARCTAVFARRTKPFISSWAVITEAAWLVRGRPRAAQGILQMVWDGVVEIPDIDQRDAARWIGRFLDRYQSTRAQFADAMVMYL